MMWDKIDNSPWTMAWFAIILIIAWLADRWVSKKEQNKNQ